MKNDTASQLANIRTNICLGLGHELFNMHGHVSKKRKETHKATEVVALIYINVKRTQTRVLRVLVDTGASATVVLGEHCAKLKTKSTSTTKWTTKAGTFTTNHKVKLKFLLPEFNQTKEISWTCHMDNATPANTTRYNMIIGRDLLQALGFIIDFHDHTMTWDEANYPY